MLSRGQKAGLPKEGMLKNEIEEISAVEVRAVPQLLQFIQLRPAIVVGSASAVRVSSLFYDEDIRSGECDLRFLTSAPDLART